jgi:hypothetical protein
VTAERYTAVFTGYFADKKPEEYLYLSMSEEPLEPGPASCLAGTRPTRVWDARSRSKISQEDCRLLILGANRELWSLRQELGA